MLKGDIDNILLWEALNRRDEQDTGDGRPGGFLVFVQWQAIWHGQTD